MTELKTGTKFITAEKNIAKVEAIVGDYARVRIQLGNRRVSRCLMKVVDVQAAIDATAQKVAAAKASLKGSADREMEAAERENANRNDR